jgi:hypothetical protein
LVRDRPLIRREEVPELVDLVEESRAKRVSSAVTVAESWLVRHRARRAVARARRIRGDLEAEARLDRRHAL